MDNHAMPRDSRVRGSKGRYETKPAIVSPATDGSADCLAGNGARVAIILIATWDTPTLGDNLRIGPMVGASVAGHTVLTPERGSLVMRLDDYGDVILGPQRISASGTISNCVVWEVVWHPEDI